MARVPIWLVEREVGGGLPPERTYRFSSAEPGRAFGFVVLPDGLIASRISSSILLVRVSTLASPPVTDVAEMFPWRLVEAAVAGEFGLAWEPL